VVPRFLTLADVAEELNISAAQTYALVRNGDLRAIKVGGRGQWRVESSELERFISQA
jgi:excisionase family DNA binding protein